MKDSEVFLRLAVEGYERGDVGVWGVDANYVPEHACAELGYFLSREHRGKRLMPKAVRSNTR